MNKKTKQSVVRSITIAMVFMLFFSPGSDLGKIQAKKLDVSTSVQNSQHQTTKIDKDLAKQFGKEDQVTFLVKMKDQVNTVKVAEKTLKQTQKNKLSAEKTKLKKRTAVISSLRKKSLDTQVDVKKFLKKQKKVGEITDFHSYYIVNSIAVTGSKNVAEELTKFGEVEKVLPNRERYLIQPNHSKSKKGLTMEEELDKTKTSDDDNIEPNIEHIGAPKAWDMGIDGSGVVVGSLDSGVQWDHPALKRKYRGFDQDNPDQPKNEFNWFDAVDGQDIPYDDFDVGTHTTGTMVGSEENGSNQVGVAPGAQWIAAKAFSGPTGIGFDDDILAAGEWLLAPKDAEGNPHPEKAPDVINNSWGSSGKDEFYREMVQSWRSAGIFPMFPAGDSTSTNPDSGTIAYPGNYPESFAVGATHNKDGLAFFSLRGPSPYGEMKPEVVAPGVLIRSSTPGGAYNFTFSGTAMATATVSGTVALLMQANSSLTVDDIEDVLLDTAKPLTDDEFPESPSNGYGHGLIQADKAVSRTVAPEPEITIENPKDGSKTNRETVTVEGTVTGENPDVEVNGQVADVSGDKYSKRILLDNGENEINVVATDDNGNDSTKTVTINAKYDAPKIEDLSPREDIDLSTGESVKVEFDSEPGLNTTFFIHMPLTNNHVQIANATELPMKEDGDGHYVGYWTVPSNVTAEGAVIEVKAVDDFSNETRKTSEGKLFINIDDS